jgi:hypothetical protein
MTNYNDLKRAGQNIVKGIEDDLEKRSEEKAQKLVEKFNGTRGFWVLPHISGWMFVAAGVYSTLNTLFKVPVFIAAAIGFGVAVMWWNAEYTKRHPFFGYLIAIAIAFGPIFLVAYFAK